MPAAAEQLGCAMPIWQPAWTSLPPWQGSRAVLEGCTFLSSALVAGMTLIFCKLHLLLPEEISECKWGWHLTTPSVPAQSVSSLCWFGRSQEKPLKSKSSCGLSGNHWEVRRTELINGINTVQSNSLTVTQQISFQPLTGKTTLQGL